MADATSRPMKVPATFVPYLEKHRIYELFQELLSRVIIKRPDDHLQFLRDELLEIVRPPISISSHENKAKEGSKRSQSSSTYSDKSLEYWIKTESLAHKVESDATLKEEYEEEEETENIHGSIDYLMNETLASMNEEEFKTFSEEVISNWRTLRRSNKFFNIRELPAYQHKQEQKRFSEDSDTETDEENNGSNITLIFHDKENSNEVTKKEGNQPHMVDSADGSDLKLNHSIRSLDIKIETDETVSSDTSITKSNSDKIVTVSYTENGGGGNVNEKESHEQIVQVKLLQGIPSNVSNEIKEYIINLIKEMVEKIMLELPKHSLPQINLNVFQRTVDKKKTLNFPRGPIMIPRVILLGPPGSGKHLQATLLASKMKVIHVDMGLLLLAWETKEGSSEIGNLIRRSNLIGDELMNDTSISILQERLLREDCLKHGWVLTGYPATAAQARAIDKMETPPNRIIYLDKPLEQCRKLLTSRMYDVDTGEVGFIKTESPEGPNYSCRSDEIMSELENVEEIFGVQTGEVDAFSGYILKMGKSIGKEGHGLFEYVMECLNHRQRLLRSPEDDPKFLELRFKSHEALKTQLLKYYGGWCTKLNVDSLSPTRVHEAILSAVTGLFPSFEEAGIGDRSSQLKLDPICILGSRIEAKIKLEMTKFISTIR